MAFREEGRLATLGFEDTYKYGGTVLVNVTVDENGNVTSTSLKQGSPFPDINRIALTRAKQIKFSKGTEAQSGYDPN